MKKFLLNTAILLLVGASIAHATIFTTNGDGTVYSFEKLSTVSGSGVTKDGNQYVLYGTCTIAQGDQFVIDNGATVAFDEGSELIIEGACDLRASSPTKLTKWGNAQSCQGITVRGSEGSLTEVANLTFEYVGLRSASNMNVRSCHFLRHNGSSSGALYMGSDGASFHITDCTFEDCQKAAICGAANFRCPAVIEGCTFLRNSQANGNVPQLNLTVASNIEIRNCLVEGDPNLTMVGGIAFSNFMGYTDTKAVVEGCIIKDNRYGITTLGIMDVVIAHNQLINNNHEVNANNGGSGISLYDPYLKQKAFISDNHIEGNLWGITVIGCGEVNIGKTEVPTDAEDYNPGRNVFVNNANNGVLYDLYNNSTNTVYAQGNIWNVESQDKESIEKVIFHKNDNPSLGEVIFIPAGDPAGISRPVADGDTDVIYRLDGTRMNGGALPHGIYIVNGKKVVR